MYFHVRLKIFILAFCWMLSCFCQTNAFANVFFHKPPFCPGRVPKDYQVLQALVIPSTLSCTAACASSPVCNSVVFDRVSKTCHLSQQVVAQDCLNTEDRREDRVFLQKDSTQKSELCHEFEKDRRLFQKHFCKNGGTPRGNQCECVPGYIGEICELGPMRDCYDYFKVDPVQGSSTRMYRPIDSLAFPVNCYNDMTTLMFRKNNKLNFNRPWQDYRDGFGDVNDNHWLGLEKMHILTSQGRKYTLRFAMMLANTTDLFSVYENVVIKKATYLYQLTFDSFRQNDFPAGDCLSDLRGASFSTYDSDNDGDSSVNCAARHQGGWWFRGKTCSSCNPTGQLLQPANGLRTGVDSEVFWIKDLGDVVPHRINFRLNNN